MEKMKDFVKRGTHIHPQHRKDANMLLWMFVIGNVACVIGIMFIYWAVQTKLID